MSLGAKVNMDINHRTQMPLTRRAFLEDRNRPPGGEYGSFRPFHSMGLEYTNLKCLEVLAEGW